MIRIYIVEWSPPCNKIIIIIQYVYAKSIYTCSYHFVFAHSSISPATKESTKLLTVKTSKFPHHLLHLLGKQQLISLHGLKEKTARKRVIFQCCHNTAKESFLLHT